MKALIINATIGIGSTGTIVHDIQELCIKNGIDCRVAYARANAPKQLINGFKIGNLISNKLHALLARINGKQAYYSYFSTINLIKKIDRYKPDVINIHNLHSNFIHLNTLLKAIAKRNIPLVVTLHDCWYFTGGCFHFTNVMCSKWLKDCKSCPKKMQDTPAYFKDCAHKILCDRYKYFSGIKRLYLVGVSEWITSLAKKTVFKNAYCCTIHNGIDTEIFRPRESDLKTKLGLDNKYIVLGPATKWLDPINRELLMEVNSQLSDRQVLLLFGCKDNVPVKLSHVKTFGFTADKTQLAELYSMADVFINCSREDTLSTINIEAQACGTPLITYDNTGSKETANPQFSICVKTGDIFGMLSALRTIPKKDKKISDCLFKWVYENYNKSTNYNRYIELFNKIANTNELSQEDYIYPVHPISGEN